MKKYTIIIFLLFLSCGRKFDDSDQAINYQRIVDECENVLNNIQQIGINAKGDSTLKPQNAFNPNVYLSKLKNVKLNNGYVLDYVMYVFEPMNDGNPIIYARKKDENSFRTYAEFKNRVRKLFNVKDEYFNPASDEYQYNYMKYIELVDTEQSYFEYVIFDIFLNQFYLCGHSNYFDWTIVCTKEKLYRIFQEISNLPDSLKNVKLNKSIEPIVLDKGNDMEVSFCIFSHWGGLIRKKFSVNKSHPHYIKDKYNFLDENSEKPDTLIKYDVGFRF